MGFVGNLINKRNDLYTHHKGLAMDKYRKDRKLAGLDQEGAPESTLGVDIEQQIADLQTYQVSPESEQRLALLEQGAVDLREVGQESTDIARMQAGMTQAPGSSQALKDIQASTSGQVQAIQQMGGSASGLGAISQVGLNQSQAMKDFAKSNLAYKSQSETALMNALRNQAQMEAQAAGLESQGLEGMIAEKDKVYQSQLNQDLTGLQFDITKLGMEQQKKSAETASQSGIFGGALRNIL